MAANSSVDILRSRLALSTRRGISVTNTVSDLVDEGSHAGADGGASSALGGVLKKNG